jgi:hypothetical protein
VFFTVIYDAQGNVIRRSIRTELGTAHDAAFGPQNQLYVGTSRYTQATSDQMTIVKFAASGATLFARSYAAGDFIYRIAVDRAGNVVAVGVADVYFNWVTLKVAANGTHLWSRRYSATGGDDEVPTFLSIDAANSIYVTGPSRAHPARHRDQPPDDDDDQVRTRRYIGMAGEPGHQPRGWRTGRDRSGRVRPRPGTDAHGSISPGIVTIICLVGLDRLKRPPTFIDDRFRRPAFWYRSTPPAPCVQWRRASRIRKRLAGTVQRGAGNCRESRH